MTLETDLSSRERARLLKLLPELSENDMTPPRLAPNTLRAIANLAAAHKMGERILVGGATVSAVLAAYMVLTAPDFTQAGQDRPVSSLNKTEIKHVVGTVLLALFTLSAGYTAEEHRSRRRELAEEIKNATPQMPLDFEPK